MLVLSRNVGDQVVFRDKDGNYLGFVTIDQIRGNKVRLGLEFQDEIKILRREVDDHQYKSSEHVPLKKLPKLQRKA